MAVLYATKTFGGSVDYSWNYSYKRVSRWIKIQYDMVTSRHSLWDYAENNEGILTHFRHGGRDYAIGQFMRLSPPIFLEDNSIICGYDATEWYRPYLIEIDEYGEYVRLYEEIQIAERAV